MQLRRLAILIIICVFSQCSSTLNQYSVANGHSHNDYEKPEPFTKAYNAGFGSIEADVFARNGQLMVAHNKEHIASQNTLKRLYIDPLATQLASDKKRKLILLIDIKEQHQVVLPLLAKELSPVYPYLSNNGVNNQLTVVISGERPLPADYDKYPSFIHFDYDQKLPHNKEEWKRIAMVSLPFNKISKWKGTGDILPNEKQRLQQVIDSVHQQGKKIRFWAAPDNEASRLLQMQLRADYIGTDDVDATVLQLSKLH